MCDLMSAESMGKKHIVSYRDPSSIVLEAGSTCEIELEVLSAAGYEWVVQDLPKIVRVEGSRFAVPTNAIGASAKQILRLRGHRVGSGVLVLAQKRPWEDLTEATREITIRVSKERRSRTQE